MSASDLVRFVIENIVNNPKQVSITKQDYEFGEKILIKAANEDIGLIIGRGGRRIKALRKLVGIIGTKMRKKIIVELS